MKQQQIPIIDLSLYQAHSSGSKNPIAQQIRQTCKKTGFFYIKNHGVPQQLQRSIIANAKQFFNLSREEKRQISMDKGGKAWRGYFEVGQQLTSGKIDLKQGLYLGQQLDQNHPKMQLNVPLHGRNLFPSKPPILKSDILEWLSQMSRLGQVLIKAISQSLQLDALYLSNTICKQHLGLMRIFHYPYDEKNQQLWAVGEHTDYGLLTILMISHQGLEVRNIQDQWIQIKPIQNTFVINIGDILEKMTKGLYKSTPHRAKNINGVSRYSIPYFYDPSWDAKIEELDIKIYEEQVQILKKTNAYERWDKIKLNTIAGSYGQYLTSKISKVFPELAKQKLVPSK